MKQGIYHVMTHIVGVLKSARVLLYWVQYKDGKRYKKMGSASKELTVLSIRQAAR